MNRKDTEFVKKTVARIGEETIRVSDSICRYAELSYEEFRSMEELCGFLSKEEFAVEQNIAGMPTCFRAVYGEGKPVIGLLGEFDALDGLSQEPGIPEHKPIKENAPGHGCGHCCLGAASAAAAVAVKEYLKENSLQGTVIYFGCPAEEGAGSKQFMARAGVFDGVDFAVTWHPSTLNEISADESTAIMGANFSFKGIAAHAGGSPWFGRSALDAAELMNVGCNYLREHIPDGQRIHYAYANAGGSAPNVVPAFAKIKYEVRARKVSEVKELFRRVVKCAEGAATMTETEMQYEITMAFSDFSQNSVLAETASECLMELGAPEWGEEDYALAKQFLNSYDDLSLENIRREIRNTFGRGRYEEILEKPLHSEVFPYDPRNGKPKGGSTDVGDVSYAVPVTEIRVACACVGNIGHTWQMAGQAGSSIGHKGLLRAAEVMALTCIRVMNDPERIEKAKVETLLKNGGKYECPLPDSVLPPIGRY
ncbi:MAG: amidohydrolase [Stomatobaculum sp.]|nr:amidohydrolase [Stomatobaculum sp.]